MTLTNDLDIRFVCLIVGLFVSTITRNKLRLYFIQTQNTTQILKYKKTTFIYTK